MERCDKHPLRDATVKCTSCRANLCDECVTVREGNLILCYECALKTTLNDLEDVEKVKRMEGEERAKAKRPAGEKISKFTLFLIISITLIALEMGVILTDYFLQTTKDVSYISSNVTKVRHERDMITWDLHSVSMAINRYRGDHGGLPPEGLDALIPEYLETIPTDPSTGLAYLYRVDGDRYTIECPSPETYDMLFLRSENGKIFYEKIKK